MREIVLDTETTGLNPAAGDKIIEIACIEIIDGCPTGRVFHTYLNPQRPVGEGAYAVHGISDEFLKNKPVFAQKAKEFLDFIGSDPLVIHNAPFDLGFLNAELKAAGHAPIPASRAVDTQKLARTLFPGQPVHLDSLCRRFGVDNSARHMHGALIDAELLFKVYMKLKQIKPPGTACGIPKP